MAKPKRILGSFTIGELSELFAQRGHEPDVLAALRAEMRHRKPSATELLRHAVEQRFPNASGFAGFDPTRATRPSGAQAASAVVTCVRCAAKLRMKRSPTAVVAGCPRCGQDYQVHWDADTCVVQPKQLAPGPAEDSRAQGRGGSMTLAQAYQVAGALPTDAWDPTVKKACRMLMQQYHPDRCASAPIAVQKLAEAAFKQAREAYDVLEREHPRRR